MCWGYNSMKNAQYIHHITYGWANNDIGLAWLSPVFGRDIKPTAQRKWWLLIMDDHRSRLIKGLPGTTTTTRFPYLSLLQIQYIRFSFIALNYSKVLRCRCRLCRHWSCLASCTLWRVSSAPSWLIYRHKWSDFTSRSGRGSTGSVLASWCTDIVFTLWRSGPNSESWRTPYMIWSCM